MFNAPAEQDLHPVPVHCLHSPFTNPYPYGQVVHPPEHVNWRLHIPFEYVYPKIQDEQTEGLVPQVAHGNLQFSVQVLSVPNL